jgi:hypothetical protein
MSKSFGSARSPDTSPAHSTAAQRGLRAARFPTPTPNVESWPVAPVPASR